MSQNRSLAYVLLLGVLIVVGCGRAQSTGKVGNPEGEQKMSTQAPNLTSLFAPHPGTIVFKTMWNHTERTEQAANVPDENKFVYIDAAGSITSDTLHAAKRVPIVEVEMSSFDANGQLVEPAKAAKISISEYGPDHVFLRHSSGPGGAH